MPETTAPQPTLSAEQTAELLRLLKGSDSVELKLTVPDSERRSAVAALGMDLLDAQIRQIVFFDTPDLRLHHSGLVVRARRVQARDADSVVKLRPVDPATVDPALRKSPKFGIEVDAMPGGFVCSASLKEKWPDGVAKSVLSGDRAVSNLFSKDQRRFFKQHAPESIALDDLTLLGPINVLKLKLTPEGLDRRLVAELWFYPDGSRLLELSTKCLPPEAFNVAAETKVFLFEHGIDLSGRQATKTRTALELFAGASLDQAES